MADFPIVQNVDPVVGSPAFPSMGGGFFNAAGGNLASATFSAANKAIFMPFPVFSPITIVKLFVINGTTVSGNIDVGIYTANVLKIVSSGSTAQSGTSAVQEFNITDTLLNPGFYYLAVAMDNGTAHLESWALSVMMRTLGIAEASTAFPLPTNASISSITASRYPFIGATQRATI